jgi:diguanylate cyclase (GGDEF)-like protein
VLIVHTIENIYDSATVAERIIQNFSSVFKIEDYQVHITPSVGIALYPDNGITPEILLKNADTAMYRAKLDGCNNFAFYSEELTIKPRKISSN